MYYSLFLCYDKQVWNHLMIQNQEDIAKIVLLFHENETAHNSICKFISKLEFDYAISRIADMATISYGWHWYYNNWPGFKNCVKQSSINLDDPILEIWKEINGIVEIVNKKDSSWRT